MREFARSRSPPSLPAFTDFRANRPRRSRSRRSSRTSPHANCPTRSSLCALTRRRARLIGTSWTTPDSVELLVVEVALDVLALALLKAPLLLAAAKHDAIDHRLALLLLPPFLLSHAVEIDDHGQSSS